MTIIEHPVRRINVVAGIAIIVLPILALAVKFITPGWMLLILLYAGIFLGAGYVLLVVMAASGFFGRRAAFSFVRSRRARIAGLGHSISVVLFMFFLVDGGDNGDWSSPFITVFGLDRDAYSDLTGGLSAVSFFAAIGLYIWFFIEWVIAVRVKRRVV
jgi:hypothetical protein